LFASLLMSDTGHLIVFYLSNQEGSAFDFGELEEAIVLQGVKIRNDEAKARMLLSLSLSLSLSLFIISLYCDV